MKRDLAEIWNLIWEIGLLACAGFALLNLFAPPQDLPWKPLDLDRPVGGATAAKVAAFGVDAAAPPEALERATETCMKALRDAGVQVERAADRDRDGGFCVVRGAVRIAGGAVTPLAPANVVMQCPLAVRYVIWDRQVLRPVAREELGSEPAQVENVGTYACRRIYGSRDEGERPSEHAARQRPGCLRRHPEGRPHHQRAGRLAWPGAGGAVGFALPAPGPGRRLSPVFDGLVARLQPRPRRPSAHRRRAQRPLSLRLNAAIANRFGC